MTYRIPTAHLQRAVEPSATPNSSGPAQFRQARFGEVPQCDLRTLVADMVD